MKKTTGATRKAPTHFEQVPIDLVKKVAEADVPREDKAARDKVMRQPAPGKSRPAAGRPGSRRKRR